MAFTCMRMLVTTFSLTILLAICIVSFEVDFWSSGSSKRQAQKSFAHATPLPGNGSGLGAYGQSLVDAMDDVDLPPHGKDQKGPQLWEQMNLSPVEEEEPKRPVEETDETLAVAMSDIDLPKEDREQTESKNTEGQKEKESLYKLINATLEQQANIIKEDPKPSPSSLSQSSTKATYSSKRRTRAKTFLVVFMGHSGSTAFTTELRMHADFLVELLEPLEHGEFQFDTDKALERARKLMDHGIRQGKIPGFKIRPFHVSNKPELWHQFVREYDTKIIWQYRENVIKQAVGEYRHKFLNDTSVVEGLMNDVEPCKKGSGQMCRFKIENFPGLHLLMNEFSTSDELLTRAVRTFRRDNEMHIVRYEDYLYNRERVMREAFDFLGVDYQNTRSQRRKASPDNLCEMVSNFQELCDRFMPCQLWRPYLNDDRNECHCESVKWQPFNPRFCHRDVWYQSK